MARRRRRASPYECGQCSRWRDDKTEDDGFYHKLGAIRHEDGKMEQIGHCDRLDVTRPQHHETCPDFDTRIGTQQRLI